mgnify:CR=1 FL=1
MHDLQNGNFIPEYNNPIVIIAVDKDEVLTVENEPTANDQEDIAMPEISNNLSQLSLLSEQSTSPNKTNTAKHQKTIRPALQTLNIDRSTSWSMVASKYLPKQ